MHEQRCCAVQQNKRTRTRGRETQFVRVVLSPLFSRVKMKGKERGGGVFSWWKEKKNLEKEEIFHVFFFHLPFFLSRDAFFNTLKRSRARELKRERERERGRVYTHTHTHTHTHIQRIYSYVIFCVIFTVFRRAQQ